MVQHIVLMGVALLFVRSVKAADGSSCSATNTNGDQTCSITCPAGQSASCSNGTGSTPPSCKCVGGLSSGGKVKITLSKVPGPVAAKAARAYVSKDVADKVGKIKYPISVQAENASAADMEAVFRRLSLGEQFNRGTPGLYCQGCGPANECKVCPLGLARSYCDENGHPHVDCVGPF